MLLLGPTGGAIAGGNEGVTGTPTVLRESTEESRVMFHCLSLAPAKAQTVCIALDPDGLGERWMRCWRSVGG